MNNDDYAALVALDWGDKTHAFARQMTGAERIETGTIEATPEALHAWLEQLRDGCGGRPVALAVEAGRNALLHALLEHPWLTVYPVHPATSARFRKAFTPSGAKDAGRKRCLSASTTFLSGTDRAAKPFSIDRSLS